MQNSDVFRQLAQDAVQKLVSVPIFELRVFAEQKLGMAFLPLTSLAVAARMPPVISPAMFASANSS